MKTRPFLTLIVACSILSFFNSCKKDNFKPISSISVGKGVKDGPIPPYVFDWTTATYMPSPTSQTINPVPMPWNSGTTSIDANLVSDYKKTDGWVLVYNTFSPTTPLNDPNHVYFFSLYNIYRGLIRFYLWQPASSIATSYVKHGLSLYGTQTSPMLNFNAQEIVDPTQKQVKFSLVLNQQVAASGGTWFAYQYEMAYDPGISSTSFPATGLTLASQWENVSNVTINGTLAGSIKTTQVGTPNSDINFGSLLTSGVTTFAGGINYASVFSGTGNPWTSAITSAVAGVVKGFFSAILGGSASDKPINLTINTQIKLTGSVVNNGLLEDMKLVLPGQSNSQTANGNTPYYNQILGIFNVTAKPVIKANFYGSFSEQITDPYDGSSQTDYGYSGSFWFDATTINIIWNPAIINSTPTGATIQNINKDLVVFLPATGAGSDHTTVTSTSTEQIGNYNIKTYRNPTATNPVYISYYTQVDPNEGFMPYTPSLAVRVSFDVVPNNGGKKVTLVKTFVPSKQPYEYQ